MFTNQTTCRYDERQPLPLAQFRELHEEMISMRGQLSELKQMVKLSFDLQLDIQRAIRQEVAATLASGLSQQNIVEGGGAQVHICPLPTLSKYTHIVHISMLIGQYIKYIGSIH